MNKTTKSIVGVCVLSAVIASYEHLIATDTKGRELRTRPEFIQQVLGKWEGCRTIAYKDTGGILTVGIGSTQANCGKIDPSKVYSESEVAERLKNDLWVAEQCINRNFNGRDLPQTKFEALTSISFNIGCNGVSYNKKGGMTGLRRLAIMQDYDKLCDKFLEYSKGRDKTGKLVTIKGLYNRRVDERNWCLKDD